MLFARHALAGIADGRITLAFRRWDAARIRVGACLRTEAGVIEFGRVDRIVVDEISDADARRAGFSTRRALVEALTRGRGSGIFRIELRRVGPDPRIALRQNTSIGAADLEAVAQRLARIDAASRRGPWTARIMALLREEPGVRAATLAARLTLETLALKRDVRKLKDLGLIESLAVGYRLSPRVRTVLHGLADRQVRPHSGSRRT
jgi:hypothetical protein